MALATAPQEDRQTFERRQRVVILGNENVPDFRGEGRVVDWYECPRHGERVYLIDDGTPGLYGRRASQMEAV